MKKLESVGSAASDLAFSPDWRRVARDVAFSPDDKLLAIGISSGVVFLHDVGQAAWAARVCPLAHRNLSAAEWNHYLGSVAAYRRTCPGFSDEQ